MPRLARIPTVPLRSTIVEMLSWIEIPYIHDAHATTGFPNALT
jgi:hypothetical protein